MARPGSPGPPAQHPPDPEPCHEQQGPGRGRPIGVKGRHRCPIESTDAHTSRPQVVLLKRRKKRGLPRWLSTRLGRIRSWSRHLQRCNSRRRWAVCPWTAYGIEGFPQRCRYHSMQPVEGDERPGCFWCEVYGVFVMGGIRPGQAFLLPVYGKITGNSNKTQHTHTCASFSCVGVIK